MTVMHSTVGYVGLGNMGGALAARLAMTTDVTVWDAKASAVQSAVEAGCTAALALDEIARECDVVLLCLPTSDHVEEVVFGPNGLEAVLQPGALIIDQTTGDPRSSRRFSELLGAKGIAFVDAPVSGGREGARAGTITIMVGGSDLDFGRAEAVLSRISTNIFHVGDVGSGHVMKLVNNLVSGIQRLVTYEGMTLAAKNGVAPQVAQEILATSGGSNAYITKVLPRVLEGSLDGGFTLGLAHKDIRLACELASSTTVPLLLGNLAREMYLSIMNERGAEAEVDAIAVSMERAANTRLASWT